MYIPYRRIRKKEYHKDISYNALFRVFLWVGISDKSFQVLMENFESTYSNLKHLHGDMHLQTFILLYCELCMEQTEIFLSIPLLSS